MAVTSFVVRRVPEMTLEAPRAKRCLVDHGTVYTVRKGGPIEGTDSELMAAIFGRDVYVKHVGRCIKRKITRAHRPKDLGEYVHRSAFRSVEAWWAWIRDHDAESGTLWEVTLRDREEGLGKWMR